MTLMMPIALASSPGAARYDLLSSRAVASIVHNGCATSLRRLRGVWHTLGQFQALCRDGSPRLVGTRGPVDPEGQKYQSNNALTQLTLLDAYVDSE